MNRLHSISKERGFSMVEILISIVVMSIGLLGLSGLQMNGLRHSRLSSQGNQSVMLAYDLSERIQSNPGAIETKAYDQLVAPTSAPACNAGTPCSSADQASYDMYEWSARLANELPLGVGVICIDSSPSLSDTPSAPGCDGSGDIYSIKVWWDRDGNGAINNDDNAAVDERDIPVLISFQP